MRAEALIRAKRDGRTLDGDDIARFIADAMRGDVSEGQLTAFLMAVWFRGMTPVETAALTRALLESGRRLRWSGTGTVDKHSTGGVGDKVSLCLAPMVAACGARVPMVSGRGLGHTGGTLDKLSAIPGFRSDLSLDEAQTIVEAHGLVLAGQSDEMCPADRRLYALRDVTATVDSVPLICASILSKKLAEGLDALVLDVKVGSGAFMKTRDAAEELARALVRTGAEFRLPTTVVLSDMDQPLGQAVGNRHELAEALDVLEGGGPPDLVELTFALGAEMLTGAGVCAGPDAARARLAEARDDGRARELLARVVAAQGGDLEAARAGPALVPSDISAEGEGFVVGMDAEAIGRATMDLGAGRRRPEDAIDVEVGAILERKRGDRVASGDRLGVVWARDRAAGEAAARRIAAACRLDDSPPDPVPLVLGRLS